MRLQALAPAEYLTGDDVIDLSDPSIRQLAGTLRGEHGDDVSFATCRAAGTGRIHVATGPASTRSSR